MTTGECVYREDRIGINNTISGILRDARKQLDETPAPPGAFHLIWFHVEGIDLDLHWQRMHHTFYGAVQLLPLDPPGSPIDCYYFDYAFAWNLRTVDAVVLSSAKELQLLVNDSADRLTGFRQTALYSYFAAQNAAIDLGIASVQHKHLICSTDVPGRKEEEVLAAMQRQTGVKYTTLRPVQCSASVFVDGGPSENHPSSGTNE